VHASFSNTIITITDRHGNALAWATAGGAGSAVNEALAAAGLALPVVNLGLPDRHLPHGKPAEVLAQCGLDAAGIAQSARQALTAADTGGKLHLARPGETA